MTDDELNKLLIKQQQQSFAAQTAEVEVHDERALQQVTEANANATPEVNLSKIDSSISQASNTINLDFSLGMSGFYQASSLWENPQLDELYGTANQADNQTHNQTSAAPSTLDEQQNDESLKDTDTSNVGNKSNAANDRGNKNAAVVTTSVTPNTGLTDNNEREHEQTIETEAEAETEAKTETETSMLHQPVSPSSPSSSPFQPSTNADVANSMSPTAKSANNSANVSAQSNPRYRISANPTSPAKPLQQTTKRLAYPNLNKVDVPCELKANEELQLAVDNVEQYIDSLQTLANQLTIHYHEMSSETAKMMTLTKNLQDVTLDNVSASFEKMLLLRRRLVNSYKYITGFSAMAAEIGSQWQADTNSGINTHNSHTS